VSSESCDCEGAGLKLEEVDSAEGRGCTKHDESLNQDEDADDEDDEDDVDAGVGEVPGKQLAVGRCRGGGVRERAEFCDLRAGFTGTGIMDGSAVTGMMARESSCTMAVAARGRPRPRPPRALGTTAPSTCLSSLATGASAASTASDSSLTALSNSESSSKRVRGVRVCASDEQRG
jgi:hypothetical protein